MQSESRFDKEAAQWDDNPTRVELARGVGAKIRDTVALKPHWRVLDYGAGTGLVTLSLQPHVANLVAVDLSSGMLAALDKKIAAAGITNVQTRLWDLESQPFPEIGFDLVVSSMTLHHLRNVAMVFQRFAALLKPGGSLAVADLDSEDGSFHREANGVFHQGFDRREIQQWLTDAGFARISIKDAHRIDKPDATGRLRSYNVFLASGTRG